MNIAQLAAAYYRTLGLCPVCRSELRQNARMSGAWHSGVRARLMVESLLRGSL